MLWPCQTWKLPHCWSLTLPFCFVMMGPRSIDWWKHAKPTASSTSIFKDPTLCLRRYWPTIALCFRQAKPISIKLKRSKHGMTAIALHMGTYTSLWQQQSISQANETSYKRTGVLAGATKSQTDAVENLKVWTYSFCCVHQLTKEDISTRDRRVEPSFTRCCQREP